MSDSKQTSGKRGTAARLRGVPLAMSPAVASRASVTYANPSAAPAVAARARDTSPHLGMARPRPSVYDSPAAMLRANVWGHFDAPAQPAQIIETLTAALRDMSAACQKYAPTIDRSRARYALAQSAAYTELQRLGSPATAAAVAAVNVTPECPRCTGKDTRIIVPRVPSDNAQLYCEFCQQIVWTYRDAPALVTAMAAQRVKGKRAARRRLAELYSESDYPQTPETRQRSRQRQPEGVQR